MGSQNQTFRDRSNEVAALGVRVVAAGVMTALLLVIPAGRAIG